MFQDPRLAHCHDRRKVAQRNKVTGHPEDWLTVARLRAKGFWCFSFDFFVDWSTAPPTLMPIIWVKAILTEAPPAFLLPDGRANAQALMQGLIAWKGEAYWRAFAQFAQTHRLRLQCLLFREVDWLHRPEPLLLGEVGLDAEGHLKFEVEMLQLPELQARIRQYSGGKVMVGQKGLRYGTSALECFLSRTDSAYPGDVDALLVDARTFEARKILEYKKHNLQTPIEAQQLSKYYPHPDGRKYDRLAVLRDYLHLQSMICIYFPTKTHGHGLSEKIVGKVGALKTAATGLFPLPRLGDEASLDQTATLFTQSISR